MSSCRILHNPRCSKSRKTLELLNEKNQDTEVCEYLKETPTVDELDEICKLLNCEPFEIIRTGEAVYKDLNVDAQSLSRKDCLQLMVDNPVLIQRPIVIKDGKAVIGRPPENVLDIL